MAHPPASDSHALDAATRGADAPHVDAHDAIEGAAHGAEHASNFPPFDASLFSSQLIWFAITFALLYYIVSRFILPSVSTVLEKRASTISGDLEAAAAQSAAAEAARTDMEKASAQARAEARAMVDAARAEVTKALTAEQEAAETRLAARINAAETRVNEARQKALAEVPGIAETLAREIVGKLSPNAGRA